MPRSTIVPGRRYPLLAGWAAAGIDISEYMAFQDISTDDESGRTQNDSEQERQIDEMQPDFNVSIRSPDPGVDEEEDKEDETNDRLDSESIAKNRPKRNRLPPLKSWLGERPIYTWNNGYAQIVGKSDVFCAESLKKTEKELEKMRNKIGRVKRNNNKHKVQKHVVHAIRAKRQKK